MSDNLSFGLDEVSRYYDSRVPALKQSGAEWRGPCPIHKGDDENFAVEPDSGLWCCHSRCGRGGDILALEMELSSTAFPDAKSAVYGIVGRPDDSGGLRGGKTGRGGGDGWRQVAEYVYQDEDGNSLFRVVRKERGSGASREKLFFQSRWHGGGWQLKLLDTRRVPYRLPKLLASAEVFMVEGEKDVETLERLGLVATCNPGGSGSTGLFKQWADIFTGKNLVILPDNDEPGRKHAAGVAEALKGSAASIRIVELPGLAEKGDASDWVEAGGTLEALRDLVSAAGPVGTEELAALRVRWRLDAGLEARGTEKPKSPFTVTENGVFWLKPDGDGGVEPVKLSAQLEVVADTRGATGDNWGRLLRWPDRDGKRHEWSMPMEALSADAGAVRARLMDGGLPFLVTNARLREKFSEYLQSHPVEARLRCVSRVGWHGESYVLPGFSAGKSKELVFQPASGTGNQWATAGTVKDWREGVGRKCTGNSRLLLVVSCGFAGPLLSLAGGESGGVHFVGATSTGKSTALVVGASVCGGGLGGFVQSWRSTLNGLEAIAEAHNDATLFLDELAQVDAREAADTAYMLGNGQGKGRMSKGITAREPLRWRLLFVSTGEVTLADHAASAGKRIKGGAEVRLLNVEADAGMGMGLFGDLHGAASADLFAVELKDAARRVYGAPLREFLGRLVAARPRAQAVVDASREAARRRWVPTGAAGEVFRAAERFAVIGAAGELASEWEITGWELGAALSAAERCFFDWLHRRGTAGSSDSREAIRQVRAFIETHGASRFQCFERVKPSDSPRIINRAGFIRTMGEEVQYLVLGEAFRTEVCTGLDYRVVARKLAELGFIHREEGHLTIKARLPDLGSTRVYCIREAIMEFDDAGSD